MRAWSSWTPRSAIVARELTSAALTSRRVRAKLARCCSVKRSPQISACVRIVPTPTFWLIVSLLRSRMLRICWRESGLRLRALSSTSTGRSGSRPSWARTRATSSALTPDCRSARTNACFTARTSACESETLLSPLKVTRWLILSSDVAVASRTSPALYLPDAISWNCWIVMLTLEKLTRGRGMARAFQC